MIRRAGAADVDGIVALNAEVFGPQDAPGVRALLTGPVDVEWLVAVAGPGAEQPGRGTLAAACARIPLAYELDGVALPGSQIENVTTDARFRRRYVWPPPAALEHRPIPVFISSPAAAKKPDVQ